MYRSPKIVIRYRSLGWASHVARMEEGRRAFKILTSTPAGKNKLWEDQGVDERTMLEWILNKYVSIRGIGLIWLRIGITGKPL